MGLISKDKVRWTVAIILFLILSYSIGYNRGFDSGRNVGLKQGFETFETIYLARPLLNPSPEKHRF